MFDNNLQAVLIGWVVVIAVMGIARHRRHTAGVGLVLAYILNLWMIHWAASLLYLLPWFRGPDYATTVAGTEQSLYAVAAFAFGSLVLAPFVVQSGMLPRATGVHEIDPRLPRIYIYAGVFFFVLIASPIGGLPSVSAILSSGQGLIVVGLSLCWWQAWKARNRKVMFTYLAISCSLPFITVFTRGFISSGAVATISFLIFISNFSRSKVRVVALGFILGYAALSVYVTYMRDRGDIRRSVWGGESLSDRIDRFTQTVTTFEFFDPHNLQHLERIENRLNQSSLVGAAVIHLRETGDYARGDTLIDALLALVPRAFWPDKPIVAGSGTLVGRYTGIRFDTSGGTSIGIGSVMEFYVNFGTAGVVIGFIIMGLIVTALDALATERLVNSDLNGFVLFYLPGLAFLQVGGQLVEVTASAAGALIVSLIVNRYLHRYRRVQPVQASALAPGLPGIPPAMRQNI